MLNSCIDMHGTLNMQYFFLDRPVKQQLYSFICYCFSIICRKFQCFFSFPGHRKLAHFASILVVAVKRKNDTFSSFRFFIRKHRLLLQGPIFFTESQRITRSTESSDKYSFTYRSLYVFCMGSYCSQFFTNRWKLNQFHGQRNCREDSSSCRGSCECERQLFVKKLSSWVGLYARKVDEIYRQGACISSLILISNVLWYG